MNKDISIILVDDSKYSLEGTNLILKNNGFEKVDTFDSASQARGADLSNYDLAILDIVMPKETGISFTKYLKEEFPKVKVILISSLTQEEIKIESIQAGADDFILKPIEEEKLISSIDKIFS